MDAVFEETRSKLELDNVRQQTEFTRKRYDRIAPIYDALEWLPEFQFQRWRKDLWRDVRQDEKVLELGVGTGKNMPWYPKGTDLTAIDISENMLTRADRRAKRLGIDVKLQVADAQELPYPDAAFGTVVTTFVFCSVPDPIRGLREARRVLKPGGRLLMVEHVLSERPLLRHLMGWLDPVTHHLWGAHIDRETVANVRTAGFIEVREQNLALDIVKRIEASAPGAARRTV